METTVTVNVVVVYERKEYYVSTQASSDRKTLLVDLLQCQLLSLMGVMLDEQILVSSTGEILYSPTKSDIETIPLLGTSQPRFFLLTSTTSTSEIPEMSSDWRQICTKSTFGDVAVVQPAFRKIAPSGGDPFNTLICEPCARTCFQSVNPREWNESKVVASRFISEVTVVAGEVDVAAPTGFTKLPVDLNYSASGDYVYLCVKRGGPRASTQLHVQFEQLGGDTSANADVSLLCNPENVIEVDCNSGGVTGDGTGMRVYVGYDSVQLKGNMEQLETLAITDIAVVIGDQRPPSTSYIMVTRNFNEGIRGAQPIFLYYRLAPLGGFVCDSSQDHSEFGECLFAARHLNGLNSMQDFDERRLTFAQSTLLAERKRGDAAIMDAYYRQHQPEMLKRLQSGLQRAQSYENKQMQEEALKRIPVDKLHERARANPSPMLLYQDELVKQLLHWFKGEFFTWMNQPRCSSCNHEKTRSVRTEGPSTAEEIAGQASRVEVYMCPACGSFTRFPRYNDPVKLLDTRTGRCGEWANCFTLCCRAMGFEARYVLDVTDHVWTEVYSEHFKRWLHCDSCEDQLDSPLTYEVGWGKKLSYIFSFAHNEVVDSARRYTQNWAEMLSRRQSVSEKWLEMTISQINHGLWEQLTPERLAVLTTRARAEREDLLRGRSVQMSAVKGRVSGSAEWKSQRSEDGKHEMDECSSPFCRTGRNGPSVLEAPSDANERAANAIQVVTALSSKGFSSPTLAMLLCPTRLTDIRNFLWKNQPLLYLPLQDAPFGDCSVPLIDVSGHHNHVENSQYCALRKPFRIPGNDGRSEDRAFGMQLLEDKVLVISGLKAPPTTGFVLSLLLRVDQNESYDVEQDGIANVLTGRFDAPHTTTEVQWRIFWSHSQHNFTCELQVGNNAPVSTACSLSVLKFGQYAHIAVMQSENSVGMYINGTTIVVVDGEYRASAKDITIRGPARGCSSIAAVISHLVMLPANSPQDVQEFCEQMKKNFVSAPPLQAFGPQGERSEERCSEVAAGVQSGYRVARVLMWGGQFFDGIQFVYEKASTLDDKAGSESAVYSSLVGNANARRQESNPTATIELLPDEIITRMNGRKGAWTDSVTLFTNFGRTISCGGNGGGDFSVPIPAQSEIRSITFKVGDHLTDACAFVLESSSFKELEGDTIQELDEVLPNEYSSRQSAIAAALRYLENIVRQPEEPKFQRIRASNKFFASNVGVLGNEAAKSFMLWCGFTAIMEQEDQFFAFQPPQLKGKPSPQRLAAEAHKRIHFLKNVVNLP
ncbi:Peptide-N(4)-(N-acetyl-beta-glucosaminyl)asparagine amidase [Phytophthora megakarya]|uniref:Peptide-N(4)-(N-acetyl-beta-glucosaminyl)asparagine amidase n=1 Tax=Phytophthora megakarya TaxID=4795 RepID=A0A225X562_9STRA|nr:Peptide-N(4)-(N-acetyl-beta-glucosaminyl)asparagine amidase [Phytophthora megakarya]